MAAKICWDQPEWERVVDDTFRMQVPGGWLIRDEMWSYDEHGVYKRQSSNLAYIPDPAFTWEWPKGRGEEK